MQRSVLFNWCALGVCDPQTNRPWHSVWEHSVSFNWCAHGVCDPQTHRPLARSHAGSFDDAAFQPAEQALYQQGSRESTNVCLDSRHGLQRQLPGGHKHFYTLFRDIADHLTNTCAHAVFAVQAAGSASTCHSPSVKCWLMQAQQTLMQVHQKDSGAIVGSWQDLADTLQTLDDKLKQLFSSDKPDRRCCQLYVSMADPTMHQCTCDTSNHCNCE